MNPNLNFFELNRLCDFLEEEKFIDYISFLIKLEGFVKQPDDIEYFSNQIKIFLR